MGQRGANGGASGPARRCRSALRCAQAGGCPVGWDRQGVTPVTPSPSPWGLQGHPVPLPGYTPQQGPAPLCTPAGLRHSRRSGVRGPPPPWAEPRPCTGTSQGPARCHGDAGCTPEATKDPASAPALTHGSTEPNTLGKRFIEAAQNTATASKNNLSCDITSKNAWNPSCCGRRERARK